MRRYLFSAALLLGFAASSWAQAPAITNISPTTGGVGENTSLWGSGFGSSQGSSTVTVNGVAGQVTYWGDTYIAFNVPSGVSTTDQTVNVKVNVGGVSSNSVSFNYVTEPHITSISPTTGGVGEDTSIWGSNFGTSQGSSTVTVNGVAGNVGTWTMNYIEFHVPSGVSTTDQTVNVVVHVGGVNGNAVSFNYVTEPHITSMSPTSGAVGTDVYLWGSNFGTTQGTSLITVSGVPSQITYWSQNYLAFKVPNEATTGNVIVTVSGVESNGVVFTVTGNSSTSGIYFYFSDALGTSRVITASDGTVCYDADLYPFGGERAYVNNCDSAYKFTGKERDSESGLDDLGARYYSSQYGRFMTADEFKGGIVDPFTGEDIETNTALPYADITDPQTLNKYGYVRNNPLRYIDPNGHCFDPFSCGLEFAGGGTLLGGPVGTGIGAVVGALVGTAIVLEAVHIVHSENTEATSDTSTSTSSTATSARPGTLGKPDHQETANEEATRIGGQREVPILTPGGAKDSRRADAAVTDNTGKVTGEVVQVYRPTPAGNIPKREQEAARDIHNATGVKPTMVPVRPVRPPKQRDEDR